MSYHRPPGRVENLTGAFLVSFGVIVFISLWMVSVFFGFLWAVGSAYACDKGLSRIGSSRE
jgi:hypothetical protein